MTAEAINKWGHYVNQNSGIQVLVNPIHIICKFDFEIDEGRKVWLCLDEQFVTFEVSPEG